MPLGKKMYSNRKFIDEAIDRFREDDYDKFNEMYQNYFSTDFSNDFSGSDLAQAFKSYDSIFADNPSILHIAVFFGANKILETIISFNKKIPTLDKKQRNLCHFAAAGGNLEFFNSSIDKDFISDDINGWNIMHYAAEYNQPKILEWGIENKIPADKKGSSGNPLKMACNKNYIRCIEVLCKSKDVQKELEKINAGSPILLTCLNNRLYEAIPILMEAGLNPGKQWYDNWPLLFFGAASNSDSIPKELIRRHVDVNLKDVLGWRALQVAASRRRYKNVDFLLNNNANPLLKTGVGFTAFQIANTYHNEDPDLNCAKRIRQGITLYLTKIIVKLILEE